MPFPVMVPRRGTTAARLCPFHAGFLDGVGKNTNTSAKSSQEGLEMAQEPKSGPGTPSDNDVIESCARLAPLADKDMANHDEGMRAAGKAGGVGHRRIASAALAATPRARGRR